MFHERQIYEQGLLLLALVDQYLRIEMEHIPQEKILASRTWHAHHWITSDIYVELIQSWYDTKVLNIWKDVS